MISILLVAIISGFFAIIAGLLPKGIREEHSGAIVGIGIGLGLLAAKFVAPSLSVHYHLMNFTGSKELNIKTDNGDISVQNVYRSLKKNHPDLYASVKASALEDIKYNDLSVAEALERSFRDRIPELVAEKIPYLNGKDSRDYLLFTRELLALLRESDVEACARLSIGYGVQGVERYYTSDMIIREYAFVNKLLTVEVLKRPSLIPQSEFEALFFPIVQNVKAKYGEDIFQKVTPDELKDKARQVCEASIDIYTGIVDLESGNSGAVAKKIFSATGK